MKTGRPLLVACLLGSVAGCATLGAQRGEVQPEDRLRTGLTALSQQQFETARGHLEYVYTRHWKERTGQRAALALAALSLDPRNPERSLYAGADITARYLNIAEAEPWTTPIAETLYLVAQELGATEERVARAEAAQQQAENAGRNAPSFPGTTVPAQLRALRTERDDLRRRVESLEVAVQEKDQELERIRATIRP